MEAYDFFKEDNKKETLEEKFSRERIEWKAKVKSLSKSLKDIFEIPDLMTELYTERQICVEYNKYLLSILIKLNAQYRRQYNERQEYYTFKSQVRYPNETSKNNRILYDLEDIVTKRKSVENHASYMEDTIKSIDHIIWAVPRRVEIEQISRGK